MNDLDFIFSLKEKPIKPIDLPSTESNSKRKTNLKKEKSIVEKTKISNRVLMDNLIRSLADTDEKEE